MSVVSWRQLITDCGIYLRTYNISAFFFPLDVNFYNLIVAMATRVLKKKIMIVSIGQKTYRYTEVIEEILDVIETIDLTQESNDQRNISSPQYGAEFSPRYSPAYSQLNSPLHFSPTSPQYDLPSSPCQQDQQ